jgi:dsRNA-specific ribonuclease
VKVDGVRILYRLEPHEGAPADVFVIAVLSKREAYGEGTARAAKRLRELARRRARGL